MAKFKKRMQAHKLRKKGWSIKSIADDLDVSKGSVSAWCKDVELTKKQKQHLKTVMIQAGHKGRMIGAEVNRKRKLDTIEMYRRRGKEEINRLSKRDLLIAGTTLYWAEGSKKSGFAFVNSDPQMIQLMYVWFQNVFDVKKEEFMPRISINEVHRYRIKKVIQFWSEFLDLPEEQFGKPFFVKVKQRKVYENHNSYYGVLALRIRRSSALKYRILGLIEAIREEACMPG